MTPSPAPSPTQLRSAPPAAPVVLFDGVCNLCNGAVQWIIDRDPEAQFRFASLQSEAARRLLAPHTRQESLPDSIVFIDEAGVHFRSDAALRIAQRLGGGWGLLAMARVIPRPVRDMVYRLIARNRYRWFGREESCYVPTPQLAARFLDADPVQ